MQVNALKDNYNTFGFVKIPSFYKKPEVDSILEQSNACLKNKNVQIIKENDSTTVRSIMHYHDYNTVLNQFSRDSRIIEIVESITNSPVYISQSKINLKKGKRGKKWDYHRGFTFWHFLDGKPKPNMVSVFICLSDQTVENGAVYVLKESHENVTKKLLKEESEVSNRNNYTEDTNSQLSIQIKPEFIKAHEEKYEREYLLGNAGDVFLMHPCLLHASDKNTTNKSRDLMITVYNSIYNLPTMSKRPEYLCESFKSPLKPYLLNM